MNSVRCGKCGTFLAWERDLTPTSMLFCGKCRKPVSPDAVSDAVLGGHLKGAFGCGVLTFFATCLLGQYVLARFVDAEAWLGENWLGILAGSTGTVVMLVWGGIALVQWIKRG